MPDFSYVALVGLWQVLSLDSQIRDLQSESASLDRKVTEAAKVEKTAGEIRKWTAGDVVWLDELRRMSERFPPSQDAMLTQLQMLSGQAGSDITMEGLARNVEAVKTMEEKVQDTSRRMVSKDKSEDTSLSPYSLRFRSTLVISPKERR